MQLCVLYFLISQIKSINSNLSFQFLIYSLRFPSPFISFAHFLSPLLSRSPLSPSLPPFLVSFYLYVHFIPSFFIFFLFPFPLSLCFFSFSLSVFFTSLFPHFVFPYFLIFLSFLPSFCPCLMSPSLFTHLLLASSDIILFLPPFSSLISLHLFPPLLSPFSLIFCFCFLPPDF